MSAPHKIGGEEKKEGMGERRQSGDNPANGVEDGELERDNVEKGGVDE